MFLALKFKAALAAAVLAPLLTIPPLGASVGQMSGARPDLIIVAPGPLSYRPAGDFSRNGRPANAPLRELRPDRAVTIMKRQVTAAEYQRCVDAGACAPVPGSSPRPDYPVVGVSWRDADA